MGGGNGKTRKIRSQEDEFFSYDLKNPTKLLLFQSSKSIQEERFNDTDLMRNSLPSRLSRIACIRILRSHILTLLIVLASNGAIIGYLCEYSLINGQQILIETIPSSLIHRRNALIAGAKYLNLKPDEHILDIAISFDSSLLRSITLTTSGKNIYQVGGKKGVLTSISRDDRRNSEALPIARFEVTVSHFGINSLTIFRSPIKNFKKTQYKSHPTEQINNISKLPATDATENLKAITPCERMAQCEGLAQKSLNKLRTNPEIEIQASAEQNGRERVNDTVVASKEENVQMSEKKLNSCEIVHLNENNYCKEESKKISSPTRIKREAPFKRGREKTSRTFTPISLKQIRENIMTKPPLRRIRSRSQTEVGIKVNHECEISIDTPGFAKSIEFNQNLESFPYSPDASDNEYKKLPEQKNHDSEDESKQEIMLQGHYDFKHGSITTLDQFPGLCRQQVSSLSELQLDRHFVKTLSELDSINLHSSQNSENSKTVEINRPKKPKSEAIIMTDQEKFRKSETKSMNQLSTSSIQIPNKIKSNQRNSASDQKIKINPRKQRNKINPRINLLDLISSDEECTHK